MARIRHYILFVELLAVLIGGLCTLSAHAGEVVTEATRSWARKAIDQEKALDPKGSPNRIAVLYFHNETGRSDLDLLQKGLTVMLITDLSKVPHVELVERVKLQALVEELKLGASGLVARENAPRVGRLLGAGLLLGGRIAKRNDETFLFRSDLMSVAGQRALGSPSARGLLVEELFEMEKALLFEIIELLRIDLSPRLREDLKEPLTADLDALLHLFRGIEQADEEAYDKASESFRRALEKDPALASAIGSIRDIYREQNDGFEAATGPWRIPWDPAKGRGGSQRDSKKPCAAERNKIRKILPKRF